MNAPTNQLPWPLALAALAAFANLALSGQSFGVPPLLGLGLIGHYAFDARVPAGSWGAWMLRVLLFGGVILANLIDPCTRAGHPLYPAHYVHAAGQVMAAELVLHVWREHATGAQRAWPTVLLSGIVFLAGCNVMYTQPHILHLAQLYFFSVTLAFCGFGAPAHAGTGNWGWSAERARGWSAFGSRVVWVGIGAWLLASVLGTQIRNVLQDSRDSVSNFVLRLGRQWQARHASGFSGAPTLGGPRDIQSSMERVLQLSTPGGVEGLHLRMLTFDRYIRGRWDPPLEQRRLGTRRVTDLAPRVNGPLVRVTRLTNAFYVIPAPLHGRGMRLETGTERTEVEWGRDDAVMRLNVPAPFNYELTLGPPAHQGPFCPPLPEALRWRLLSVPPEIDPRVRQIAAKLNEGLHSTQARVMTVEQYLRANHSYSLSPRPGPGDPVSDFLLNGRDAHCEYFASAAVILLRCMGVPARYVTGYYAHEQIGPDSTIVRQQDAHAWAECWSDQHGWITVEATPPDGRPDQAGERPGFFRRAWEATLDAIFRFGDWITTLSWVQLAAGFMGLAALCIAVLFLRELWLRRRRRREGPGDYSGSPEFSALLARFESVLKRHGLTCPPHQTWREFLDTAATPGAAPAEPSSPIVPAARTFLDHYNTARFGPPNPAAANALQRALTDLEKVRPPRRA